MKKIYNQLELHYYFYDHSHEIDAIVRNECEKELLHVFYEIIENLELKVKVETSPPKDGGFVEIWKFVGENADVIALVVSLVDLILSRYPIENKKLTQLQIENLELDNQLKREELRKLGIKNIDVVDDSKLKQIIDFLLTNYKIIWRRSNFFKKMTQYRKINKISFRKLLNFNKVDEEQTVLRLGDFENFILFNEEIPDVLDKEEFIDVISPVLKRGRFRWKGFWDNQIIDFHVEDEYFMNLIYDGKIRLNNKVKLKVKLNYSRKIDDNGKIKITKYYVSKIISYFIGNDEYQVE